MGLASRIQPWAPTLARLVASFVMASLLPFAASAAGETTPLTDSDLRWLCQQPSVARVKVTRIDVDAPDAVCEGSPTGDGCRTIAAEVIVLESLPLLGAARGLPLKPFLSNGPNRVRVRMVSRAYADLKEAPFALVGVEGLLAMRELPEDRYGKPAPLRSGVILPGRVAAPNLDTACRPIRHWSGQQHPALPEQLPGEHPARTESVRQLARRLAGMVGPMPPEPASLEQRFGARLVTGATPTPEESNYRALARLDASWVRIWRRAWQQPSGRPRVNLMAFLTDPYPESREAPWWDDDPSDRNHKVPECVRPSMVLKELGEEWPRDKRGPPYHSAFVHRYPDYRVSINFLPHGNPPLRAGGSPNTSDECIDGMSVFFEPI